MEFNYFLFFFIYLFVLCLLLLGESLIPQCPHKIRHVINPLPSYQHPLSASDYACNEHLVTVISITSRWFQVCHLWCATEAEDPVTVLVKYIHFKGLELILHIFSLDWNLPLIPLYNWQESATERSGYIVYGNYHAYLTHLHELITLKENYMGNIMGHQITQWCHMPWRQYLLKLLN